jgi:hypothetical protein
MGMGAIGEKLEDIPKIYHDLNEIYKKYLGIKDPEPIPMSDEEFYSIIYDHPDQEFAEFNDKITGLSQGKTKRAIINQFPDIAELLGSMEQGELSQHLFDHFKETIEALDKYKPGGFSNEEESKIKAIYDRELESFNETVKDLKNEISNLSHNINDIFVEGEFRIS